MSNVLISGIDTLEIGYCIHIYKLSSSEWDYLSDIKASANTDTLSKDSGCFDFYGQSFCMSAHGVSRYEYVFSNADITVRLHRKAESGLIYPELVVTFRSSFLWRHNFYGASLIVQEWLNQFCVISEEKISRVDLCCDLNNDMPDLSLSQFVTRGRGKSKLCSPDATLHHFGHHIQGYTIGKGDLMFRLYDKSSEILASNKLWFKDLWSEYGYKDGDSVVRFEFQIRRNVLRELLINSTEDLFSQLGNLWDYCVNRWLSIRVEGSTNNRHRDTHQLWKTIRNIDFGLVSGIPRLSQSKYDIDKREKQALGCLKSVCAIEQCHGHSSDKIIHRLLIFLSDQITSSEFLTGVIERKKRIGILINN